MWTNSGVTVSSLKGDTLLLRRAYGDGDLTATACLDNGGDQNCQSIVIEVMRPIGVEMKDGKLLQPIEMQSGILKWNSHARIKVWSIEGRLLLDETGSKGRKLDLPSRIQNILDQQRSLVKIEPLK